MDINELKIKVDECKTLKDLNDLKVSLLGKKGPIQALMSKMGTIDKEKRAEYGQYVNNLKNEISDYIENRKVILEEEVLNKRLQEEKLDISLDGIDVNKGSKSIVGGVIDEICDIFVGMGYEVKEGPEVELDHYNFELLNVAKDHPARDMQDSFYISENTLLRTQTSPIQVRTLEKCNGKGPVKIICPGKVYRRDDDDATHSHQFTQIEGLVVDKNVTMSDLKGTLETLVRKMFGEKREIRFRSSFFPFTEPSVEVDVSCFNCEGKGCNICKGSGWIEILGAGMVHPNVLRMSGFDPEVYQGFAFGMGVERIAMLRYGITDIRHLYMNDKRVLKQFKTTK
ncbi:MAG: phenylalanine--tRNA ligase subunit alpha [Bacilli bacterium]|nr:phenylalanine--tRNA ligase subunit alpha [Bacilli bacterium]